jgi:DNA polymerase-3 subunit alpha
MLEGLILAGCFDSLGLKRAQLMAASDRVLKAAQDSSRRTVSGQVSLFDTQEDIGGGDADDYPDIGEYAIDKLLAQEKVATGVYLSGHPLDKYKTALENREVNISKIMSATDDVNSARYFESRMVDLVGILSGVRRRSTKAKQLMANALLEDLYGMIEIIIFPSVFQKCESLLTDDAIVRVSGRVDVREDEAPQLLVESISPFAYEDAQYEGKKLYVRIPKDMGDDTERLRRILATSPGMEPVAVSVEATGEKFRTNGSLKVTVTAALVSSLTELFGNENVVVK